MNVEDELTGKKRSYLMMVVKSSLIGLVCGAVLGAIIAILGSGPSAFFSKQYSPLGSEKEWAWSLLFGFTKLGAMLGVVVGLIVGSIITFIRR